MRPKNFHHSEEWKRKISEKLKGQRHSPTTEFKKGIIPWNKGKHHSEETKRKIGLASKGRKHSEEVKKKLSEILKGLIRSEETKRNISQSRKGHKASLSVKKKMSLAHKGKKISEAQKIKLRLARIKYMASGEVKFKDTSIEQKIEKELQRRNIYYEKQVPLCKVTVVDFYLPETRTVIYCNGIYWHSKKGRKDKDINQDVILNFNGFNVYRFTEAEINKSSRRCINKIFKEGKNC